MKRSKISLGALAFVLAISGTLAANALQSTNSATLVKNGWYGQLATGGETSGPIDEPTFTQCVGEPTLTCAIEYTNDVPGDVIDGGRYQP